MNTLKRKRLQEHVMAGGNATAFDRKFSTDRRKEFVRSRRELRRYAKNMYFNTNPQARQQALANSASANFDCLLTPGGPLMVPCVYDYKFYEGLDLLDLIEEGMIHGMVQAEGGCGGCGNVASGGNDGGGCGGDGGGDGGGGCGGGGDGGGCGGGGCGGGGCGGGCGGD
ncbi:hypothetical protein FGO68_gene15580 [Halteria grandinella]|uniref:Uncharacterized protein n=1 Tax=Halteria grandinella TaxID=5974 RepID=A0A8J8T656_HALGN|nr:hypothetical protein FGO68_gene15580 [Halteria grandinella]